jgi:DNA polymerase elongation subunit (family B)
MNFDATKIKIEDIPALLESLDGEERTKAIDELKTESLRCYTQEQGIKLIINSIYGAFANEYFHFYNIAVAETVTLQGQDAIRFTERMVDKYFKEFFHRDKPLLKELGVSDDAEVPRIKGNVWKYTDTDSGYLIFEECMDAVKWQGSVKDFVLKLNSFRLSDYIKKVLQDYAKSFHTDNYLDFELETIAENAIWVAKKKYIQNIIWKDGKHYDNLTYIKTTGLEIIQSSTPVFCRGKLIDAVKYMFAKGKITEKHVGDLVKLIKEIKREFKLSNIEKISMGRSVSDYQKFIINDQDKFEIQKGCPIHVRAAGYYNYLLNQNPSLKGKYEMIRSGDKLKWYHSTDEVCDVFAYKAGGHPVEFAPKMNIERQFQSSILDPLNRILVPAGLPALNPSLAYTVSLF